MTGLAEVREERGKGLPPNRNTANIWRVLGKIWPYCTSTSAKLFSHWLLKLVSEV